MAPDAGHVDGRKLGDDQALRESDPLQQPDNALGREVTGKHQPAEPADARLTVEPAGGISPPGRGSPGRTRRSRALQDGPAHRQVTLTSDFLSSWLLIEPRLQPHGAICPISHMSESIWLPYSECHRDASATSCPWPRNSASTHRAAWGKPGLARRVEPLPPGPGALPRLGHRHTRLIPRHRGVSMIRPAACPLAARRCASAASARSKVAAMRGVSRPLPASREIARRSSESSRATTGMVPG
jgi:hypothetical protein